MNNFQINSIIRSFDKSKTIFHGTFPSDKLPNKRLRNLPAAFVVNLSPSNERGTHWIAIFIDKHRNGYYFDSFGNPPVNGNISRFLQVQTNKMYFSKAILQSTNSSVCGGYAICFILFMLHNPSNYIRFQNFFTCNQYINDYCIKKTINVIKQRNFC